ncbi:Uncharacterized protein FKW44_022292, partial [Caligus rogercresseyi]
MEDHLGRTDGGDPAMEVKLFFSKLARGRAEAEELRSLSYAASRHWYNVGEEPFTDSFIDASDRLEDLAVRGADVAERHHLDVPRLSGTPAPATITVEREKRPALHYDAVKVIGSKFSGEGPPTEVLRSYSVFKKKWGLLKRDISSNFDGCNAGIIFDKFKDCLEGRAHLLANEAASYDQAVEELDKFYENSFKLAKAYLDGVKIGASIQDLQKSSKIAMCQVAQILEDAQSKGVSPVDFLLITFVNEKLPARAVADWEAMLISKEEEHKRRNILEGTNVSWKPGSILNVKDFSVWLEAYATRHKEDEVNVECSSAFRATE